MHTTRPRVLSFVFLTTLVLQVATSALADDPNSSPTQEKELLAILRSDAPAAEKAIACKSLAVHGSSGAVADLAKLLPDEQLSSWSRIALEAIPGAEADEALRNAAESLTGRLLVGTINSIGIRRDAQATDSLAKRLQDLDAEVASAAAVALGRISNDAATESLRSALASAPANVRSAVAEGYVLCAERLLANGDAAAATKIYDEIRNADVPMQRIIEATRGAILARNQDGIPLLIETFQSADKKMFQLALGTAREFPGGEVDQALASEMARATPERAALIVQAMADRPDTVVLATVLKAASEGNRQVRVSAIDALRRVGDDSCLEVLLRTATEDDADLAQAARETLAELPGDSVNAQIVAMLDSSKGENVELLLGLVAKRRIDAVDNVVKALDHSDPSVRNAAFVALGETVTLEGLPVLISQVVAPKHSADAEQAQRALKAASIRMPDREKCASVLVTAMDRSPPSTKNTLLEIIADVGGSKALMTLASAAKSSDPQLQDTGSRLLGKWNSVDAAPVLLDLAKTAPAEKYRIRALRGFIGIARKFPMPDAQRAEMCEKAFETARRPDEQKLVLDVLQLHPSSAALNLAIKAKQVSAIKNEASAATLVIAQKLGGSGVDVGAMLSAAGLEPVKLEIVKAEYGAGAVQKDVTEVIRRQAKNLPLVMLASENYNASFGGDPAPGTVKQLKIRYRINGQEGEASFAENALIILPIPN